MSYSAQARAREAAVLAARELVPALKARARDTESRRRLNEETLHELHERKLFRILQPARLGGGELPFATLIDVTAELAKGCASTAWVVANLATRHWMLAMFPKAAQEVVWGDSPDTLLAASVIFTAGRARAVPGGFVLNGRWPFASGIHHSSWVMLAATVPGEGGQADDSRLFLVPALSYRVADNWQVAGLAGTGSADVVVEEVFVPEALSLSVARTLGGPTPGHEVNASPLYQIPLFAVFPFTLSGVALGNAQGFADEYLATTRHRVGRYGGAKLAELQSSQLAIARATAQVDSAARAMHAAANEATVDAERGVVPAMPDKARWRRDGAYAVGLCTEAVGTLFNAAGAAAIHLDNPLQRHFRDAHAIQSHIAFSFDIAGSLYGRVALGLEAGNPFL
ncbi:MAG: acyl-CoA dehydrogenase family protein [Rhizobacter sp.]